MGISLKMMRLIFKASIEYRMGEILSPFTVNYAAPEAAPALRTGRVSHFAWRQPSLVELFREAVADPAQREEVAA